MEKADGDQADRLATRRALGRVASTLLTADAVGVVLLASNEIRGDFAHAREASLAGQPYSVGFAVSRDVVVASLLVSLLLLAAAITWRPQPGAGNRTWNKAILATALAMNLMAAAVGAYGMFSSQSTETDLFASTLALVIGVGVSVTLTLSRRIPRHQVARSL